MSPDKLHAELGAPEVEPSEGMTFTFVQKAVRIAAPEGFRDLELRQLDGLLLALDWVVDQAHHVWGSAVMVGPGVALTAGHVVAEMRAGGFLGKAGGQLFAVGFHADRVEIWRADSITAVDVGDLAILTLIRTTALTSPALGPAKFSLAKMDASMPRVGELLSLIGYRAAALTFEGPEPMGLSLLGGVGAVTDVYPVKRDASLPGPSLCVAARTINGMSGGAAFDEAGNLIGIISTGLEAHSFVSLSWPATYAPIAPKWPPKLAQESTSLGAMAKQGLCGIEHLDDVVAWQTDDGQQMVSISGQDDR
jgi:Trypsin-like peptidase domain